MGDAIRYPNMGTVKKAAEIYGLSPSYIRRLCKTGKSGTSTLGICGWSIWTAWPGILNRATRRKTARPSGHPPGSEVGKWL